MAGIAQDRGLPVGTVTLLMADVEESVRRWEADRDAAAAAFARLDEVVTDTAKRHRGVRPLEQGEGDSFLITFARPSDAVACALDLQLAFARETWPGDTPLRVRMALHTGEVDLRDDGRYAGHAFNRGGRLRALAHGGQTLVSRTTHDLVGGALPPDVSLEDLGEHRLRDLGGPQRVFQLCHPALRGEFPPLRSDVVHASATTRRPLIGRSRELAELSDALAEAAAGRGGLRLITGDPGIGKTRLAEELGQEARAQVASVHWGSCWEVGGAPTYWPWLEVFRGITREVGAETATAWAGESAPILASLVPGLGELALLPGASAGDDARFRLFDAVTGFFERAATTRPVVLVLDDVHAADRASLLLLHFLGRRLRDLRLLIVATSRDLEVERDPQLSELIGNIARLGRRLPLGGLDAGEVAALVEQATGAPPSAEVVEAVLASTGGNPFFVHEVARLLTTGRTTVPVGVKQTVSQNLALLPPPVQETLAIASVLGREFPLNRLTPVVGRPAEDLLEMLGSAASARMVRHLTGTPGRFQFAHALIRDTLYEGLGAARRQALHLAVAEHLETAYGQDSGPHLAELAHHFTQASSEKAVDYSTRAAQQAMSQLAYEEAVGLYQRALDMLEPSDDPRRFDLLLALDDACNAAGSQMGEDAVREALQIARRMDRPDLFARASLHVLPPDETIAVLDEAIARLGEDDLALRAEVLSVLVTRLRNSVQYKRVLATAAEALRLARLTGDRRVLGSALSAYSQALQCSHELDQRRSANEELLALADELEDARLKVGAYVAVVSDSLQAGDVARLDLALARFAEAAAASRRPAWAHVVVVWRAMRALLDGRLADAEPLVLQQLAMSRALSSEIPPALMAQLFHLRREQDRLADIEAEARDFSERAPQFPWSHRLALLHLDLGRPDDAREIFDRVAARDFTDLRPDNLTFSLPLLSELAWALNDRRRAALLYERVLPYDGQCLLASGSMVYCTGAAARYLGLLAFTLGRLDDAVRHLEDAMNKHTEMGARLLLAHTECDLAMVLSARGAPGDDKRAVQASERARATSEELGLALVARRLERPEGAVPARTTPAAHATFQREGDIWAITFEGHTARVRHARGLELISRLLSDPGREFHALDLEQGVPSAGRTKDPSSHLGVDAAGSAGPVLDAQAKAEYKRRLDELDQEIDQATLDNDPARKGGAEEERDFLVAELRRAVGLGGRDRPTSSAAERARVNVTRAIRSGLARVAEHHPVLGEHLGVTIRTGIFCSYTPDPRVPIRWDT